MGVDEVNQPENSMPSFQLNIYRKFWLVIATTQQIDIFCLLKSEKVQHADAL